MHANDIPTTKFGFYNLLITASANGEFPAREGVSCRYRTADGRSCPVGRLIPDDKYSSFCEGKACFSVIRNDYVNIPNGVTKEQLADIQEFHDCSGQWNHTEFVHKLNTILGY
jgi:hypothetical protein